MGSKYEHLSQEELIRLLEARDRRDATKFGLVWEANEIERDKTLNNDFVALDLVPELCIGKPGWRNLIIEGDNFDALRYLRMAFVGQVKCILIDPPYNTGKKDFVYNDRFMDDVFQSTMIKARDHAATFKPDGLVDAQELENKADAWLGGIAKNVVIDLLRRKPKCVSLDPQLLGRDGGDDGDDGDGGSGGNGDEGEICIQADKPAVGNETKEAKLLREAIDTLL